MPNLIDFDFFRTYVGENRISATAPQKAHVELLIASASQMVEAYLGRSVLQATFTHVFDVRELQEEVYLPQYPVASVTSVHNDPDQAWNSSSLWGTSDYYVDAEVGRIIFKRDPIEGRASMQVVYVAGLVADRAALIATTAGELSSPYGFVANAVAQQAEHLLNRRDGLGSTSKSTGRGRSTWSGEAGLIDAVKLALDPIRSRRIFR